MIRPVPVAIAVALCSLCLLAQETHPDGEGELLKTRVLVDFGRFAAAQPRTIHVEKGDTLGSLAKEHLGRASRHQEIAALNPGIDPKRLQIGQRLLLPPAAPPAEGDDWMLFMLPQGALAPVPLRPGEAVAPPGSFRLVAVHREGVPAFRRDLEGGLPPRAGERVAISERSFGGFYATSDPRVERTEEEIAWKDVAVEDGTARLELEAVRQLYDREGRPILAERAGDQSGTTGLFWIAIPLVALGLIFGFFLLKNRARY